MATAALRLRRSLSLISTAAARAAATSSSPLSRSPFPSSLHRHRRRLHNSPSPIAAAGGTEEQYPYGDGFEEEFGCNDWMVTMRFGDNNQRRPSKEEMLQCYLETLASVVGSVEEAKKRMYYFTTASYTAFYAKIDDKTSKNLKGVPGVVSVLPNSLGFQVKKEDEDLTQMEQTKSRSGNLLTMKEENGGTREEVKSFSNSDSEQQSKNDWEQESHSKLLDLLKMDAEIRSKSVSEKAIDIIGDAVIHEVKSKSDTEQHNEIYWERERGPSFLKVKKDSKQLWKSSSEEVIDILYEDVIDEVKFWKTSVIAYALGERVTSETMLRFVKVKLSNVTTPQVLRHVKGFYILKFGTEEDQKAMLELPRRFFRSKPLVLLPWEPELDLDKVSIHQYPTWVRFPDLKLQFWGDKVLNKIASKIGVPLRIDGATTGKKRLSYARVRIAVDLSKELVKEVTLKCPNGEMVQQQVIYERLLHRCPNCKVWDFVDVHRCQVNQAVQTSRSSKVVSDETKADQPPEVLSLN